MSVRGVLTKTVPKTLNVLPRSVQRPQMSSLPTRVYRRKVHVFPPQHLLEVLEVTGYKLLLSHLESPIPFPSWRRASYQLLPEELDVGKSELEEREPEGWLIIEFNTVPTSIPIPLLTPNTGKWPRCIRTSVHSQHHRSHHITSHNPHHTHTHITQHKKLLIVPIITSYPQNRRTTNDDDGLHLSTAQINNQTTTINKLQKSSPI